MVWGAGRGWGQDGRFSQSGCCSHARGQSYGTDKNHRSSSTARHKTRAHPGVRVDASTVYKLQPACAAGIVRVSVRMWCECKGQRRGGV